MSAQMGQGKKRPVYDDNCMKWLMRLSKAALADCVVDLLRGLSGNCDEPVSELRAIERLTVVLNLRGDKSPKSEYIRLRKRIAKHRIRRIFETACEISKNESGS